MLPSSQRNRTTVKNVLGSKKAQIMKRLKKASHLKRRPKKMIGRTSKWLERG